MCYTSWKSPNSMMFFFSLRFWSWMRRQRQLMRRQILWSSLHCARVSLNLQWWSSLTDLAQFSTVTKSLSWTTAGSVHLQISSLVSLSFLSLCAWVVYLWRFKMSEFSWLPCTYILASEARVLYHWQKSVLLEKNTSIRIS